MNLSKITNIYFLGIGGIGMSGLAQYFLGQNKNVSGYDRTPSALTSRLESLGATIVYEDNIDNIPEAFTDPKTTAIIYTPAIPRHNAQWQYFKNKGFNIQKRAEVLGQISETMPCLAVAGTHGKTTTSTILAHLLKSSGCKITAFLGGISENYNSNVIFDGQEVMVVEADEFDRSFLKLSPSAACITATDADHLDIYKTPEAFHQTFKAFANKVAPEALFVKVGLLFEGQTFGVNTVADFSAQNVRIAKEGAYLFDLHTPNKIHKNVLSPLPGHHNLNNVVAAFALATTVVKDQDKLVAAIGTFKGIQRRFNYRLNDTQILIDDYAHHPTEIDAVFQALQEWYPEKRKLAVFQPHLYSRTQDFMDGFAQSLSQFDAVALLDVYPAREEPIAGINSQVLLNKITTPLKHLVSKKDLPHLVANIDAAVVVMMGAGDIADDVPFVEKILKEKICH